MRILKRVALYLLLLLVAPLATIGWLVSQPMFTANTRSAVAVDVGQLRADVAALAVEFAPRAFSDRANLGRTADYIRQRLAGSGAVLTNQTYHVGGQPTFENIVALFPSTNLATIVVGAHYDACLGTPGADDNASGVAGLIALAHLLGKTKLSHTVELVAYCTEEPPFFGSADMGSAHHARALRESGRDVVGMIALEMIGYFSDEPGSQGYPVPLFRLMYPSRGNFIAVIGNTQQRALIRRVKGGMRGATDLGVYSVSVPAIVQGIDFSDHRNYWQEGFPAVMVTDTAFLRNDQYHQPGDTPERLDYVRMAQVVVCVYEAVKRLDGEVE